MAKNFESRLRVAGWAVLVCLSGCADRGDDAARSEDPSNESFIGPDGRELDPIWVGEHCVGDDCHEPPPVEVDCGVLPEDAGVAEPDAGHSTPDSGVLAPDAGQSEPDAGTPPECTFTQGYWKTHAEAWEGVSLELGGELYTQGELLAIFNLPSEGDASVILAHQLIAALLNGGGADAAINGVIQDAQAWLAANADADGRLPFGISPDAAPDAIGYSETLDDYNNGRIGPGHCD